MRPSTLPSSSQATAAQTYPRPSGKTLNVTLLASGWGSSMGGLSTINRKVAMFLAKHNQLSITLLVPEFACSEKDRRDAGRHNIAIREAQSRPGYTDPLDWLSVPPRDLGIDIVLGHGAKLGKQAQFIKELKSCKWVQVVHTAPEELGMYKNYSEPIAKGEEKNRAEVDLCKLADLVVAVGPKLREVYSSYLRSSKKHIMQLTPGIFHEFSTTEQAPQEGEKFKVLTFGRSDPEDLCLKGYDIAAKAVAELQDSYRLVFVGAADGRQEEVAKQLVRCGISRYQLTVRKFATSNERLKELFCEVDLAIMPSRTEGFGLTALEALSAGLPILVSSNSGFGEALRDLPTGKSFVVDSEEPKEWAKAIAFVREKGRAQRLREIQTLRASYEEKYSWEDQCEALAEMMLRIVFGKTFVDLFLASRRGRGLGLHVILLKLR